MRIAQHDVRGSAQLEEDDFRVAETHEILALLHKMRDANVPVILSSPDGTSYTTLICSVDADRRYISFCADEHHLQPPRLVRSDEITAVAYLDSIRIQFDLPRTLFVRSAQGCALQAELPPCVFRFQRRSSFRVRTLDRTSPSISFRHPSLPDMLLSLRIIDVSIGGCALLLPADVPALTPGTRIQRVHVDLDADTRFDTGLVLHHVGSLSESDAHRIGCEWLRMDGAAQRSLQRYIDGTQKRRRMLSAT